MNERTEVRFGGYGGQGIALMGLLAGKAAVIYDQKEAVLTQNYGPEARGGASAADLVLSDHKIDYPLVTQPDVLVVMFQEAFQRYRPGLAAGGVVLVEEALVKTNGLPAEASAQAGDAARCYRIPATRIAESLGRKIVANVVMLGYFAAVSGLISRNALEEALRSTVKPAALELNLKALAKGWEHPQ
jgi:2-oxoglutarate ferredoxin oxidoreductase subunit gamma